MDKVDHLRNVPIFSDLSDSDLTKISSKMVPREYDKGQMILLEESHGESFFIITSGAVKVTRLSDDGREVILAILGESDFFGEMSLLDGAGRSANIVANETAVMLTLATILADLPAPSRSDISPKKSLSPNIARITSLPSSLRRVTLTAPLVIIKNDSPWLSSKRIICPLSYSRGTIFEDILVKSESERSEKIGTLRKWSTLSIS
jgi:hypothetical protein